MNMTGRSSISGTKMADYCAVVVFQDADDTLTRKPDVTDKEISRRLTETQPCQELTPWFKSKDRRSLPTVCHPKAEDNLLSMQGDVQLLKIALKLI